MQLDKVLHFFVSFTLVLLFALFLNPTPAALSAFAVGLFKETYDQISYGGWSWGDIIANTLGIALALLILKIIL